MTHLTHLDTPLPPDTTGREWWRRHDMYPTFSWSWWLRRGWVFWPVALVYGTGYASWHGFGMNALGDWPSLALVACLCGLIMVSAGPLLATGVRYIGLPLKAERILVVIALLIGLFIAKLADTWVNDYHDRLMQPFRGHPMEIPGIFQLISGILRFSLDGGTMVLVAVGGGFALFQYLSERRRLAAHAAQQQVATLRSERDAADLRLAVLQAQVEPHFLFNTLASVRSLVATDPKRAATTIDALADYLRSTLPTFRETTLEDATLGKQVDICSRYLELMNIRIEGRIRIILEISDEVRAHPFPPLILISLVENAVKHGIEPKPGPGEIAIRAHLTDKLTVSVEDDGAGLTPGPSHGLGLANVRAQLRNRFGDDASLDITGRETGGTAAVIRIPA